MDIVNVEQAEAWDGHEGEAWAADWEAYDEALRAYRTRMRAAAAVADGEDVLDVGCGNGQSTRDAAAATPGGSVLGIDLSGPMLERARVLTREAGLHNVEYVQGDAQVHAFTPGSRDIVMSRFGSMFFADTVAAFANIGAALRPGGRLLLVVWQDLAQNEQFVTLRNSVAAGRELPDPPAGSPGPFSLADRSTGRDALEAAGFVDVDHEDVRVPFFLGADADAALDWARRNPMVRGLVADLDDATRAAAFATLQDALAAHETDDGVLFDSAAWFITARRP
jgi:SAM-dependent methyltransferase